MSASSRRWRAALLAAAILALPGGCGGLLPSPPERQLYRLGPSLAFPAGLPYAAVQLAVATPTASADLDTRRIALVRTPLSLDYFADAEWGDRVPVLVQGALIEGLEKSAAVAAVAPADLDLYADFVLNTAIGDFTAVYDSPDGPPRVVVALDLRLVHLPDRRIVAERLVHDEAMAAGKTIPMIVRAFDTALAQAVETAVTWTLDSLSSRTLPAQTGSVKSRTRFVHPVGDRSP
jgi:cholesterol transport system auxiliary component